MCCVHIDPEDSRNITDQINVIIDFETDNQGFTPLVKKKFYDYVYTYNFQIF